MQIITLYAHSYNLWFSVFEFILSILLLPNRILFRTIYKYKVYARTYTWVESRFIIRWSKQRFVIKAKLILNPSPSPLFLSLEYVSIHFFLRGDSKNAIVFKISVIHDDFSIIHCSAN